MATLKERQMQLAMSYAIESLRLMVNSNTPEAVYSPVDVQWNWDQPQLNHLDEYLDLTRRGAPRPTHAGSIIPAPTSYPADRNGHRVPMRYEIVAYLQNNFRSWSEDILPVPRGTLSVPQDVLKEILAEEGLAGNIAFKNKNSSEWRVFQAYPVSGGAPTPPTFHPDLDWAINILGKWRPISIS